MTHGVTLLIFENEQSGNLTCGILIVFIEETSGNKQRRHGAALDQLVGER